MGREGKAEAEGEGDEAPLLVTEVEKVPLGDEVGDKLRDALELSEAAWEVRGVGCAEGEAENDTEPDAEAVPALRPSESRAGPEGEPEAEPLGLGLLELDRGAEEVGCSDTVPLLVRATEEL